MESSMEKMEDLVLIIRQISNTQKGGMPDVIIVGVQCPLCI